MKIFHRKMLVCQRGIIWMEYTRPGKLLQFANWKITILKWKINELNVPCSILMLVYQRGDPRGNHGNLMENHGKHGWNWWKFHRTQWCWAKTMWNWWKTDGIFLFGPWSTFRKRLFHIVGLQEAGGRLIVPVYSMHGTGIYHPLSKASPKCR